MFLKKVTLKQQGKTYNYYKIVASYRDKDGKPKHRLIQNLGALSEEEAAKMRMIIQAQQDPDLVVAKHSDLVVTRHWTFLPIILLHSLWETLQLHRFFPNALLVETMVLNRCIEPQSKIHMVDWMQSTVLPALYHEECVPEPYAVYRELDQLNKQEVDLQAHLYQQLERPLWSHFDPSHRTIGFIRYDLETKLLCPKISRSFLIIHIQHNLANLVNNNLNTPHLEKFTGKARCFLNPIFT